MLAKEQQAARRHVRATLRQSFALSRLTLAIMAGAMVMAAPGLTDGGAVARQGETTFGPGSVAPLAKKLTPAVVNISTTQVAKGPDGVPIPKVPDGSPFGEFFEDFFNREGQVPRGSRQAPSLGSGFVIDGKEGLIVTNNHVIQDADEIVINFADGKRLKVVKILGRDTKSDLALLKVDSKTPLPDVKFGSSSDIEVGDWVMAIGNPFGLGSSVSVGVISAKSRNINSGVYDDFLQTDAAINKGNSGGPLFNMQGDVIGVNTAIISPTGGSIGIGFAVPSDAAARVIAQLRQFGETRRGWLGVRLQTVRDDIAKALGLKDVSGALVSDVTADGPAGTAGIRTGDVIVGFDGKEVAGAGELPKLIAETAVGRRVKVDIVRGQSRRSVDVEIGLLPVEPQSPPLAATVKPKDGAPSDDKAKPDTKLKPKQDKASGTEIMGLTLRELNDAVRKKNDLSADRQGVFIEAVNGVAAAQKGLQAGEIMVQAGQIEVRSINDVAKGVAETRKAGRRAVLLGIEDKAGNLRFVAVPFEGKD